MIWMKTILAALLVVGFVLAAEDIPESIDAVRAEPFPQPKPNHEGDIKLEERRDGAQPPPHFKQPPAPQGNLDFQKTSIQQEAIPVPVVITPNGGAVMIPPLHQLPPPIPHKERQPPQAYPKERPPSPRPQKERPPPPPPQQQHKERQPPQRQKYQDQVRPGPVQTVQIFPAQEHFIQNHQGQPNQKFQGHQPVPIPGHHVQIHLGQQPQGPSFQEHIGPRLQEHLQGQLFQDHGEVHFQGHVVQRPQAQKLEDNRQRQQPHFPQEQQEPFPEHQASPQVFPDLSGVPEIYYHGERPDNPPKNEEQHPRIQSHSKPEQQEEYQAQNTFQTYHIQELQVQNHQEPSSGHQFQGNEVEHPDSGNHLNHIQPVYPGSDAGGYGHDPHNNQFDGFPSLPGNDPWPLPMPEMPKVKHIDVHCEKNLMKVSIEFDKPFHGIIFSKGHYNNPKCIHQHAGGGNYRSEFDILAASCGTVGNTQGGLYGNAHHSESGAHLENTVIIQYDPQVQEVWDDARKLRCMWHDHYEKIVTFNPFPVGMLDVIPKSFAGDNVGCWMQIQVGKGPWATEVAGIVRIGQTMTMVLAIQEKENKFDMMVRNCVAHDGKKNPIELVNSQGCIMRPKLMSRFTKIKNFGSTASVLSYAHFQAFKFPDSMEVHFQCTIQICRPHCPEQCADDFHSQGDYYPSASVNYNSAGRPRVERDLSDKGEGVEEMTEVGVNRVIRVVSREDLAFVVPPNETMPMYHIYEKDPDNIICMSTPGFAASLVVLLAILVISCLVAAFLCLRQRSGRKDIIAMPSHLGKCTL